jgi:GTPase
LTPYFHVPDEALTVLDVPCKESPMDARTLSTCLVGAPNAGKSSLLNQLVYRRIAAVSNKVNTTDEAHFGLFTDQEKRTQLTVWDTPGITKATNSIRSKRLVSKAWKSLDEADTVIYVVDSVKRLSFEIKHSLITLEKIATE